VALLSTLSPLASAPPVAQHTIKHSDLKSWEEEDGESESSAVGQWVQRNLADGLQLSKVRLSESQEHKQPAEQQDRAHQQRATATHASLYTATPDNEHHPVKFISPSPAAAPAFQHHQQHMASSSAERLAVPASAALSEAVTLHASNSSVHVAHELSKDRVFQRTSHEALILPEPTFSLDDIEKAQEAATAAAVFSATAAFAQGEEKYRQQQQHKPWNQALLNRVLRLWRQRQLGQCFWGWVERALHSRHMRAVGHKVTRRIMNFRSSFAFEGWRYAALQRVRKRAIVVRVVKRMKAAALSKPFLKWASSIEELRRERNEAASLRPLSSVRDEAALFVPSASSAHASSSSLPSWAHLIAKSQMSARPLSQACFVLFVFLRSMPCG
jgi:hypothetical protein